MIVPKGLSVQDAKLFFTMILSQPLILLAVVEAAILVGVAGKIVSYGLYYFLGWSVFYWSSLLFLINSVLVSGYYAYLRYKYKKEGVFVNES